MSPKQTTVFSDAHFLPGKSLHARCCHLSREREPAIDRYAKECRIILTRWNFFSIFSILPYGCRGQTKPKNQRLANDYQIAAELWTGKIPLFLGLSLASRHKVNPRWSALKLTENLEARKREERVIISRGEMAAKISPKAIRGRNEWNLQRIFR